jgi:two-component system chemotaxis response regulator CheB
MPPVIKAVVIDDSAFNRVTISRMLESSGEVRVLATAVNGEDGIKQVMRTKPDIITLDLEMPVMDGFAFLRWLMANRPTPTIVVSSKSSDKSVFKALEFGAVDFIVKPGGRVSPRLEEIQADLLAKVRGSRDIRLENIQKQIREEEGHKVPTGRVIPTPQLLTDLVVIGSSTGGPPALQTLFENLTLIPLPFVVAQHMPPTFTRLFAERLNRLTTYHVKEGEDGEQLRAGVVYIAAGGMQTDVIRESDGLRLSVRERKISDLYAPSVNRLFASASEACRDRLIAIVLTGMGDDGSESIRKVREAGGRTIAEDASTAIIFGMPGEAIKTGAVEEALPLQQIPGAIRRLAVGP